MARPPIFPEGEGEAAVVELTRRYLKVIEEEIRRYPELWLWMHRRWDKGRRGNESSVQGAAPDQ